MTHEIAGVTFRTVRVQRDRQRFTYRIASVRCACGQACERQSDWRSSWTTEDRNAADSQALAAAVTKFGWHQETYAVAS